MTTYAVFISTFELDEETTPEIAADMIAELWAQDGPPSPWIMTEEQLGAMEATLPPERKDLE